MSLLNVIKNIKIIEKNLESLLKKAWTIEKNKLLTQWYNNV
jgi:hypothetical protein